MKAEYLSMLADRIEEFSIKLENPNEIKSFAEMLVLAIRGSFDQDLVSLTIDFIRTGECWDSNTKEMIIYNSAYDLVEYLINY